MTPNFLPNPDPKLKVSNPEAGPVVKQDVSINKNYNKLIS
jgi:hypothetical protein